MRRALPTLLLALLAGCGGEADTPQPETRTTPSQPAAATPAGDPCARFMPKDPLPAPTGLIVPDSEVAVGKVTRVPPQVRVEGYVAAQPSSVRNFFLNDDGVKVTFSEDEGFEAEALITDGRHRNFWKVAKVCDRGSAFAVIIVREEKPFDVSG